MLNVQLTTDEQRVAFSIEPLHIRGSFCVPGTDQSMRVMFHSCNGFSVKVPPDAYAGPTLWNDVSRRRTSPATPLTHPQVLRGTLRPTLTLTLHLTLCIV